MATKKKAAETATEQPERKYNFFRLSEFDSPDVKGSGENMQHSTVEMLDDARGYAGIPLVINSGFRTAAHNRRIGGAPNSTHLRGFGADIRCHTRENFERVALALIAVGFRRFGAGSNFIHVDNDPSLPQTQWLYEPTNFEQRERLNFIRAAIRMMDFWQDITRKNDTL